MPSLIRGHAGPELELWSSLLCLEQALRVGGAGKGGQSKKDRSLGDRADSLCKSGPRIWPGPGSGRHRHWSSSARGRVCVWGPATHGGERVTGPAPPTLNPHHPGTLGWAPWSPQPPWVGLLSPRSPSCLEVGSPCHPSHLGVGSPHHPSHLRVGSPHHPGLLGVDSPITPATLGQLPGPPHGGAQAVLT